MGQAASPPTLLGVRAMRLHGPRSYSSGASQGSSRVVEGKASSDQSHAPPSSQVKWPRVNHSGHTSFDPVFLRDCCSCERCVDPSTTQKTFETAEIPTTIRATSVDLQNDGSVHIKWEPDLPGFQDHVSIYDGSFVDGNENLKSRLRATYNLDGKRIPWNRKLIAENEMSVQYTDYMNSSSTLLSSLRHLYHYGLLLIHSVPSNLESVASIARRIGPLKSTLYGPTWDVKSVPSAKNVAYTSSHLGFHMDLLYVDNPPGLQILHCLEASTRGGESLFGDALRAVKAIEQARPDLYEILKTFPVTYKYHNNNEWYQQTRPHIETVTSPHEASDYAADIDPEALQLKPSIRAINWSPPFQAPLLVNTGSTSPPSPTPQATHSLGSDLRQYLEAIRHLKKEIEADHAVYEKKLEPGTAVIFDNRRIVHARKAFENRGGERWLRGAYVDTDVFRSRLRVLREEADQGQGPK